MLMNKLEDVLMNKAPLIKVVQIWNTSWMSPTRVVVAIYLCFAKVIQFLHASIVRNATYELGLSFCSESSIKDGNELMDCFPILLKGILEVFNLQYVFFLHHYRALHSKIGTADPLLQDCRTFERIKLAFHLHNPFELRQNNVLMTFWRKILEIIANYQ